jgi:hypothetical protein
MRLTGGRQPTTGHEEYGGGPEQRSEEGPQPLGWRSIRRLLTLVSSSTPPAVVERCAVVPVLGLDQNEPAWASEEDDDDAVAKANVPRCD